MKYVFVTPEGNITRTMNSESMPEQPNPVKGRWILDSAPTYDISRQTLRVKLPIASDAVQVPYEIISKDLTPIREEKLAEIQGIWKNSSNQSFTFNGKEFDINSESRELINRAVQAALIEVVVNNKAKNSFFRKWTVKDGTELTMSYEDMLNLGKMLSDQDNANHAKYNSLKTQLKSANTIDQILSTLW
jgi:hypothetical protein